MPTPAVPRLVAEQDSAGSLVAAVEAGGGVALVSQNLACSARPRLELPPLAPAAPPFIVRAAWPRHSLPPAAEQFLKSARATATDCQ